ncbi:MAG: GNAT family N-acetyltransferase [Agathobaculum sp.]|uniref:GNAT family N-acetyltransferase n=1 Tax=Agathobaculum sp. TaxID=2048138 RepID=UPI0025BBBB03|nr:GNAT family N-acetyltransferase [Agathobaculum sp.]MCI7125378.1 GNAT family N-acetyltransferase [Agathobaculum sp.]MDY3711700.1 GNAT family N-acetyltransferase [Agathobaculum sp.]
MLIRQIQPSDRDYFLQSVHAFYHSPAVDHEIPAQNAARTFELLMHGTPYADCLIAEDETGAPRAYCLLALTWSNEAGGLCVWLDELMVDDALRGQGIGKKLIAAVHEKYNTAARYRLEVTAANPRAAALYHLLGFEALPYEQMVLDTPVTL